MKYDIVAAESRVELVTVVNSMFGYGWKPLGPPSWVPSPNLWFQAIVLEVEPKKDNKLT